MRVDLNKLRKSGRISATALAHGRAMLEAGQRIVAVQEAVEAKIREMGGEPAFPAQVSRNNVAAHYCSPPDDPTVIQPDDIVKLDCGSHVDGWITDNATTVDLRDGDDSLLCSASRMALENAIALMGPGVSLSEIGRAVEATITQLGFQPVRNLCGHGVSHYTIHCAPSVPNYHDPKATKLRAGQTIACEPFACDGKGYIDAEGKSEVFMLRKPVKPKDNLPKEVAQAMQETERLPFARRDLVRALGDLQRAEDAIKLLLKKKLIEDFPPLVERAGVRVAQFEHTVYIGEDGPEVMTARAD